MPRRCGPNRLKWLLLKWRGSCSPLRSFQMSEDSLVLQVAHRKDKKLFLSSLLPSVDEGLQPWSTWAWTSSCTSSTGCQRRTFGDKNTWVWGRDGRIKSCSAAGDCGADTSHRNTPAGCFCRPAPDFQHRQKTQLHQNAAQTDSREEPEINLSFPVIILKWSSCRWGWEAEGHQSQDYSSFSSWFVLKEARRGSFCVQAM